MAISMIHHRKLPQKFWAESVNAAAFIKNRFCSSAIPGKTPEEIWTGLKLKLSMLRAWGCRSFAHIPTQLREKLEPNSRECTLVVYDETHMGCWRLWDPERQHVIVSRDVTFDETATVQREGLRDLSFPEVQQPLIVFPPEAPGLVGAEELEVSEQHLSYHLQQRSISSQVRVDSNNRKTPLKMRQGASLCSSQAKTTRQVRVAHHKHLGKVNLKCPTGGILREREGRPGSWTSM
jgi:hypothetical protein